MVKGSGLLMHFSLLPRRPSRLPGVHKAKLSRGEQGSALVEIALASIILFSMVFGILQFSIGHYIYHYVTEAAAEGTRYAMVRGSSCSGFGSACPATATDVQTYVRGLAFPVLDPNAMTVTTTWPTTGPACTPSSNPCNNPGNLVHVTVTYNFRVGIPFLPVVTPAIRASSQMVISQ